MIDMSIFYQLYVYDCQLKMQMIYKKRDENRDWM